MRLSLLESDLRARIEEELRAEQKNEQFVAKRRDSANAGRRAWLAEADASITEAEEAALLRSGERRSLHTSTPSTPPSAPPPRFETMRPFMFARAGRSESLEDFSRAEGERDGGGTPVGGAKRHQDSLPSGSARTRYSSLYPQHERETRNETETRWSSRPPRSADDSLAIGSVSLTTYPPPPPQPPRPSMRAALGMLDEDDYALPVRKVSNRFVIFAATVAMLASVSALFVSAAQRMDLPRAHASSTIAAKAPPPQAMDSDGKLTEQAVVPVEVSPSPTLPPPAPAWSRRSTMTTPSSPARANANANANAKAPSPPEAAPPAPAPAPAPSLDEAARAAKMLRDQLGSSVQK